MFAKFFLLAFILASPALASHEVDDSEKMNAGAIIDVIHKLVESAKDVISENIEQLRIALLEVLEYIENHIYDIEMEILDNVEKMFYEIKQLVDAAKDLGKEGADCILQQKEKVEKLSEATKAELRKCVSKIVPELTKLFDELVQALNEVNDRLLQLLDDFYVCKTWACKVDVGKKIAEEVLNVNGVMGDKITRFMAIIRENKAAVKACVSVSMDTFRTEMKKIAEELKECLKQ